MVLSVRMIITLQRDKISDIIENIRSKNKWSHLCLNPSGITLKIV